MPELPDAVVYRRTFADTSLDQTVAGVTVADPILLDGASREGLEDALLGRAFSETRRHGKHVFARYAEGGWLALHFGMTGRLTAYEGEDHPEYAYVRIAFENGRRLALECPRKFARVRLVDAPGAFVDAKALGPDARRASLEAVQDRFRGRRGTVKGALLDQSFLAGLGNIYADEVLYQVSRHPRTPVPSLDDEDVRAIYEAMHDVLDAAVAAGADPTALPAGRFMLPHRYDDERCPADGRPLETDSVSGRTAYFCPACQRLEG
jgi:formamidopyrimidine-DNA glycosylase